MTHSYRFLSVTLLVGVLLASAMPVGAQNASDRAKAMLNKGRAQFKALNFTAAKATLLKVDKDSLSQSDKKLLAEYLAKADLAVGKQAEIVEIYLTAEKALRDNDLMAAKVGFESASESEYLHSQTRRDARARLAEVMAKMEVFEATQPAVAATTATAAAQELPEQPPQVVQAETPEPPAPRPAIELPPAEELEAALEPEARKMARAQAKEPEGMTPKGPIPLEDVVTREAPTELTEPEAAETAEPQEPAAETLLERLARTRRTSGQPEAPLEAVDAESLLLAAVEPPRTFAAPPAQPPPPSAGGILGRLREQMSIAKQVADTEFDKALDKSNKTLAGPPSEEAFEGAANLARTAKNILQENKRLYSSDEYRQKLARAEDQLTYIELKRNEWREQMAAEQRVQIEQDRQARATRQEQQRQRRIETLTERAKTLKAEQNHTEALELIKEILKIEPNNPWAAGQLDLLEQFVLLGKERNMDRLQAVEEQKVLVDIRESEIPWYEYLRYPSDWRQLSQRRSEYAAGELIESEADMRVRRELNKIMSELAIDEMSLENVIAFLQEYSRLSIHVKWNMLQTVGIEKTTTVTVHLANVTFEKALRTVLDDVGGVNPLGYIIEGGVITISTRDDLSSMAYSTTRVYDVQDLIFQVPNFVGQRMNIGQGGTGGQGGNISGGASIFGNAQANAGNQGPSRQQIIADLLSLVQDTIDPTSWRPTGEIGSIRETQGHLVVTQTAENHRKLMTLIKQLREARAIQISVESRFITVQTGFLESIGVDLDFFLNVGSTYNPGQVYDPQTGLVVNPQLPGGSWAGKPGNNKWTPMGIFQDNSFTNMISSSSPFGSRSISSMLTNSAFSVAGAFLDDIQVNFIIEATQAHHATRTLTAPRITLFNGQRSNVQVAREINYVTDYEETPTQVNVGDTTIVQIERDITTETLVIGTMLDLEATASADRRYVRLTLHPQVTELLGFREVPGLDFIELPEQAIQSVETTVSIPDGGTLLIAGLKRSAEVEREIGVPLLSKIPVINRAFTNRGKTRDEETLLILIKPKIILQPEEEELRFPPGA